MSLLRVSVAVVFVCSPIAVRADATIRYKMEISSSMPQMSAAMKGVPSSVIYMKGSKGATVAGSLSTIVDFVKQEVTVIDSEGKKYSTIPASEYGNVWAGLMPKMDGPAGEMMKSIKTKCDSKKADGVETIQGVQAEERETDCSMEMPLPEGMKAPGGMTGMGFRIVMRTWSASPGERPRVPALWQLSGFELWQKYFMNPVEVLGKAMPSMAPMMEAAVSKDQSATLRMSMEMFMDMHMPGVPAPDGPLMKMTMEVVELSTAPLDDALFVVPADYAAAPFGEVLKAATDRASSAR